MPEALVVTAPGINCDGELAEAFALAGASPRFVPLRRLRQSPAIVDRFGLVGLPGGFSYGDDIAAGRVMAALLRKSVYPALVAAIERGVPIIAPCNGFQIAVQAGLLPGPPPGEAWPREAMPPTVALLPNRGGRFVDRWSGVELPAASRCIWTRGLEVRGEAAVLPSAHGEGRFVCEAVLQDRLERDGQVAVRYASGENFNGSAGAVAGLCDASGLVLGLMPHPERFLRWNRHPRWTRLDAACQGEEPLGLRMFRNAVEHARGNAPPIAALASSAVRR